MTYLHIALTLAAQVSGPTATHLPNESSALGIGETLERAVNSIERLGACAERTNRGEEEYQRLFSRYGSLHQDLVALFGDVAEPGLERLLTETPLRCGRSAIDRATEDANAALAQASGILRDQTAQMPGLWLGRIRFCGSDVRSATYSLDPYQTAHITIAFHPRLTDDVQAATATRVNKTLSLRIDGRLIANLPVMEAIAGTEFQVTTSEDEARSIQAAAARAC